MTWTPAPGPGRVTWLGLQQSNATREPNLEPRRDTICLLSDLLAIIGGNVGYPHIPDVGCNDFALMGASIHKNPLDQVIPILITSN